MTTRTWYKWEVWCPTSGGWKYVLTEGDATEPTTCPDGHPVTAGRASVVATLSDNEVRVIEENTKTGGNYGTTTQHMHVDAVDTYKTQAWSFPFSINILSIRLNTTSAHLLDRAAVTLAPDTVIGALAADVGVGETVLPVTDTVAAVAAIGVYVNLYTPGATDAEDVGVVIAIDRSTTPKTITVETPVSQALAAATPTYVRQNHVVNPGWYFGHAGPHSFGEDKIGASFVPANTTLLLEYWNNNGLEKDLVFQLNYLR